ncbi:hypothetical protein C5167_045166 [Papaver somniferum]|uniref:Uncharacterized protein n=1 Tax=Papaver somniferum TaxID=3469 RepID=A0A4Y7LCH0_PAPSO|nr:hypothetical protein C5167_045166 [Papaver somniferum]
MHSSAGINLSKPDGDFGFALNDSNFSDKILKIEIMAADEESKSGGEVVTSWENESLLQDVIHITVMFPNGKCPFIPRKCNKPADELAKFSRKSSITQGIMSFPFPQMASTSDEPELTPEEEEEERRDNLKT